MPRIQPIDQTTATGAAADQLAATRKLFGSAPNMFTTAAHSPAALTALNGVFAALGKAPLGGKVGEQIAIAVAQSNSCEYCLSAHTAIGGMHGVSADNLASARRGTSSDQKAQAAISLALEILRTKGHVSDATLAAARVAGLGDGEVVEIVAHVALNVFTNYLNSVAGTEVDFPVVSLAAASSHVVLPRATMALPREVHGW